MRVHVNIVIDKQHIMARHLVCCIVLKTLKSQVPLHIKYICSELFALVHVLELNWIFYSAVLLLVRTEKWHHSDQVTIFIPTYKCALQVVRKWFKEPFTQNTFLQSVYATFLIVGPYALGESLDVVSCIFSFLRHESHVVSI